MPELPARRITRINKLLNEERKIRTKEVAVEIVSVERSIQLVSK